MVETFTGCRRHERAESFAAEISAAGGDVHEIWHDQNVETGVYFVDVSYDLPEETEEEEE